jgi:hypothetical protein
LNKIDKAEDGLATPGIIFYHSHTLFMLHSMETQNGLDLPLITRGSQEFALLAHPHKPFGHSFFQLS